MTTNSDKTPDSRADIFAEYLRKTHRRSTQERFIILDTVLGLRGHFKAENVISALTASNTRISTATVYSTLDLLCRCDILRGGRFNADSSAMHYELAGAPSIHLVCSSCGKIRDVRDNEIEQLLMRRNFGTFESTGFSITVDGLCNKCRRPAKRSKRKVQIIQSSPINNKKK